jgi:dsDNA-specific endonuclease/ATPase MutS2
MPGSDDNGLEDAGDDTEPLVLEITDSLDLHHFHPSEILDVVDAYLDAAHEAGFVEVRLIHGRGKGVQRARVQKLLASDPRVERSEEAPPGRGGWGATIAWLRAEDSGS